MWTSWGGRTARDVSAAHGGSYVCALLDNGEVKCWGIGQSGELGCGDAYHRSAPPASVDPGTGRTARAVAAGANHTCAFLDNGRVKCWGSRKLGVLGSGSSVTLSCGHDKYDMGDNLPYANLGAGRTAKSIVAGETHTCAILDNDRVKCWGKYAATGHGDLKTRGEVSSQMGDSLPYVDPGNQGDTVVQLSAEGAFHVCAILANGWADGHARRNVKCWGRNEHGQLGYGDTKDRGGGANQMGDNLPFVDLGGHSAKSVHAGEQRTCAILRNNELKCWGAAKMFPYGGLPLAPADGRDANLLGYSDQLQRGDAPGQMGSNLPIVSVGTGSEGGVMGARWVALGESATCVVLSNDGIKCWGFGWSGQLGSENIGPHSTYSGYFDLRREPVRNLPYVGLLWAFPLSWLDTTVPVLPSATTTLGGEVVFVSTAWRYACYLAASGDVGCWGSNAHGNLGLGDTVSRGDPSEMGNNLPYVRLGLGRSAQSISVGDVSACAILDNQELKCWGWAPGYGDQEVRGDRAPRVVWSDEDGAYRMESDMGDDLPAIDLGSGRTARSVAVGRREHCAVLDNNRLKCWGGALQTEEDPADEMGDDLPYVDLGSGRTLKAISMAHLSGYSSSLGEVSSYCAILDNDRLKCWGWAPGYGDSVARGSAPGDTGGDLPYLNIGSDDNLSRVTAVAVSPDHVCVILLPNNRIKCWGSNGSGQLGLGDTLTRGRSSGTMGDNLPYVDLGTGRTAKSLAVGSKYSCALLDNDRVKCWGAGSAGENGAGTGFSVGDSPGSMGDALPYVDLGSGRTVKSIQMEPGHTLAWFWTTV